VTEYGVLGLDVDVSQPLKSIYEKKGFAQAGEKRTRKLPEKAETPNPIYLIKKAFGYA
jgi:hypothetical protein